MEPLERFIILSLTFKTYPSSRTISLSIEIPFGVAVLMIFNISISSMAALRQKYRNENIMPQNKIDEFLDANYPDEYMDKIFANKKNVR